MSTIITIRAERSIGDRRFISQQHVLSKVLESGDERDTLMDLYRKAISELDRKEFIATTTNQPRPCHK